jgi:hypothetical protein
MKNKLIGLMGILAIVLVFGFIAMGCPADGGGGSEVTKFEGKWKFTVDWGIITYTFTGNKYASISTYTDTPGKEYPDEGSFTYTDTEITFVSATKKSWVQQYEIWENADAEQILYLHRNEEADKPGGNYIKQN